MNNQSAQKDEHGVLETTAQAIGSTLGNLAVKTGIAKPPAAVAHPEPQADSDPGHQHHEQKSPQSEEEKIDSKPESSGCWRTVQACRRCRRSCAANRAKRWPRLNFTCGSAFPLSRAPNLNRSTSVISSSS